MATPNYPQRLRLYDSSGGNQFTIDNNKSGSTSTHFETSRSNIEFDKPVVATDFQTDSGAQLSWLGGLVGVTTDLKSWVETGIETGSSKAASAKNGGDVVVVAPDITGTLANHYITVQAAINAATDGGTVYILNGTYTETLVLDGTKGVNIVGESKNGVIIQSTGGLSENVITQASLVSTKPYAIKSITIRGGKYGITSSSSASFTIENVDIENCGWDGTSAASEDQAAYAVLWASAATSEGGVCMIKNASGFVMIKDVFSKMCASGILIEDCTNGGTVSRVTVQSVLGTGITLDSSTGDGGGGCTDFLVSDSVVRCARSNGIKIVGGQRTQITGCVVDRSFNSGIQFYHTTECDMTGCCLTRNNTVSYTGRGLTGDADGTLALHGNTAVPASDYVLNASGCTFSCGGSGSQAHAYAVFASDTTSTVNVSGCGYICFVPEYRQNNKALITDAQLGAFVSQLHEM